MRKRYIVYIALIIVLFSIVENIINIKGYLISMCSDFILKDTLLNFLYDNNMYTFLNISLALLATSFVIMLIPNIILVLLLSNSLKIVNLSFYRQCAVAIIITMNVELLMNSLSYSLGHFCVMFYEAGICLIVTIPISILISIGTLRTMNIKIENKINAKI